MIYIQSSGQKLDPVFSVPKIKTVIWMVYGVNVSWLNNSLWTTSSGLSMILSVLREVGLDSYFGDNDLG